MIASPPKWTGRCSRKNSQLARSPVYGTPGHYGCGFISGSSLCVMMRRCSFAFAGASRRDSNPYRHDGAEATGGMATDAGAGARPRRLCGSSRIKPLVQSALRKHAERLGTNPGSISHRQSDTPNATEIAKLVTNRLVIRIELSDCRKSLRRDFRFASMALEA
jgi:hypothetical protein